MQIDFKWSAESFCYIRNDPLRFQFNRGRRFGLATQAWLRTHYFMIDFKLQLTGNTVEIVYNEHQDQADFARYNRFSL